jgi:transposase
MPSKFKPQNNRQLFFLPPSVEDFIPEAHLARVIDEVVEALDTKPIENKYHFRGQKSYHPKMLIKLLIYGYSTGVFSGRKIAMKCESDTAFMYLAGMYQPDFRTINDFRKDYITDFQSYFVEVVKVCQKLGMAKVGTISIDGTKISASASINRTKDKAGYEKWLKALDKQIDEIIRQVEQIEAQENKDLGDKRGDELPKELQRKQRLKAKIQHAITQLKDDEATINLTDADAKKIKSKGLIKCNYNCQGAVSEDGIIVAAYVSNSASDKEQLFPVINQAEANTSNKIEVILADSGYASFDNYEDLEKEGKIGYIPDQEYGKDDLPDDPYHKSYFIYNPANDTYSCPQKQELTFDRIYKNKKRKRQSRIYRCKTCATCPVKALCTKGKARTIERELREALKTQMRTRLDSPEGKSIYKKRMSTIEPVWGNVKFNKGFHSFRLRGKEKANAEFMLLCIAHNIDKIHKKKYSEAA